MTHNSFIFELKWIDFVSSLESQDERASLLGAIMEYGIYENDEPDLTGSSLEYFNNVVKPSIDKSHARYLKKLERKKNQTNCRKYE